MKNHHQRMSRYALSAAVAPLAAQYGAVADIQFYDGPAYYGPTVFEHNGHSAGASFAAEMTASASWVSNMGGWFMNVLVMNYEAIVTSTVGGKAGVDIMADSDGALAYNFGSVIGKNVNTSLLASTSIAKWGIVYSHAQDAAHSHYNGTWTWNRGNPVRDQGPAYIGLFLDLGGNTHYGWMELEWQADDQMLIHGWAFNDEVEGSIQAGQIPAPGAIPLLGLAMGAAGIRRTRRG